MEWSGNGNGNGTPNNKHGISIWKNYEFHAIPLEFHSTQFHSIPWNSTFHLKTPTSALKPSDHFNISTHDREPFAG